MVTKEDWKRIYNHIFNIFPPSETLDLIIKYKTPQKCVQFNNIEKFFIYICLNSINIIKSEDLEYILKDEKIFEKMNDYVSKVLKEKER